MIRTSSVILDYYNTQVVNMISEKYGYSHQQAFNDFAKSEIHKMLSDSKYAMWEFATPAIFDMWEAKKITGDPRSSLYIKGEA